jgi:Calcineurin-like phosphoesterase
MPDIRYVCLSDLHFGAQNSLLTSLVAGDVIADPLVASPTLTVFADCLSSLVAANEDRSTKPILVLNGDILDFALASDEVAILAFERFVELVFVERDLFSHHVYYIPGNHDHHLWETARERQYADYIARHSPGTALFPPWHATSMFAAYDDAVRRARTVEAELLQTVLRRFQQLGDAAVEVRYPNFGLRSTDGRAVTFHHGHYVDSLYRLMSRLKTDLFPASPAALAAWEWEAENFAWIDFFWSTLGRSGDWGSDVGVLYDMLQEERAVAAVGRNLGNAIAARGQPRWLPGFVRRRLIGKAVDMFAGRLAALERNVPSQGPLSPAGLAGLQTYIEGPLALQLRRENPDEQPDQVSFVFGHTHKPFEDRTAYRGYRRPVEVYNTGGWVVDSVQPDRRQGAAAVVIDEDLNVAALHLYNQATAGGAQVSVRTAGKGSTNPLRDRLSAAINPAQDPWARLSSTTFSAVPQRYAALQTIINRGIVAAQTHPASPNE